MYKIEFNKILQRFIFLASTLLLLHPAAVIGMEKNGIKSITKEKQQQIDEKLIITLKEGKLQEALPLIEMGANINAADDDGITCLMWAIIEPCPNLVKLLIEKGANINAADDDGITCLMWAIIEPCLDIAKLLIENGANINAIDQKGKSAYTYAKKSKRKDIISYLTFVEDLLATCKTPDCFDTFAQKYIENENTQQAQKNLISIIGILASQPKKISRALSKKIVAWLLVNNDIKGLYDKKGLYLHFATIVGNQAQRTTYFLFKKYTACKGAQTGKFFERIGLTNLGPIYSLALWQGDLPALEKFYNFSQSLFYMLLKQNLKAREISENLNQDFTLDDTAWYLQLLRIALRTQNWNLFADIINTKEDAARVAAATMLPANFAPKLTKPTDENLVKEIKQLRTCWKKLDKNLFKEQVLAYMLTRQEIKKGLEIDLTNSKKRKNKNSPLPHELTSHILGYLGKPDLESVACGKKKLYGTSKESSCYLMPICYNTTTRHVETCCIIPLHSKPPITKNTEKNFKQEIEEKLIKKLGPVDYKLNLDVLCTECSDKTIIWSIITYQDRPFRWKKLTASQLISKDAILRIERTLTKDMNTPYFRHPLERFARVPLNVTNESDQTPQNPLMDAVIIEN